MLSFAGQTVTLCYYAYMNKTLDMRAVRLEMKAKKIKVKDLAERMGLTPNTLSSALNGNRTLGSCAQKLLIQNVFTEALKKKAS